MLTIRPNMPGDLEALFEVWKTSVDATHSFVSASDMAEIAVMVRDQYLPAATLDVAVDEGAAPVAFMGMTDNGIDALFIHAGARGTGIGRQMIQLARTRFDHLLVEVNEQNEQAVSFYQHMGFVEIERKPVDGQGKPYPLLVMEWRAQG